MELLIRPRRNRKAEWTREMLAETQLRAADLILPLFIIEGQSQRQEIKSLPGIFRISIDLACEQAKQAYDLGIKAVMLFPYIEAELKTQDAREAYNSGSLIAKAIAQIKKQVPEIGVMCDVALDPYTSHGHDGIIGFDRFAQAQVLNDETIELLCKQALIYAEAGVDVIAPSDMMDGRILAIRKSLDSQNFKDVSIFSYGAKYASNFYGPFRDAVGSKANLATSRVSKKTYQMDFRNQKEALREITLDVAEGADAIIIKPGLPYLDIISKANQQFSLPIIGYQVSGEYAMLKLAGEGNIFDFDSAFLETLTAFKRAGAQAIITYGAVVAAKNMLSK